MAKAGTGFWSPPTPTRRDLRSYGILMAVVLGGISGLLWYRGVAGVWPWTAGVAAAFLALGLIWPAPLKPVWAAWMLAVRVLGFVNTHLLLGLVFYLVFTPMGLVMRLVRRDPLERGGFGPTRPECRPGSPISAPPAGESLWKKREPEVLPRDHFERQF